MNFALSIIVLTLVVALICFYPLLRSVKAKEDKKRDELNKALYFSRLKEIEQDNQQGLVENVEQLKHFATHIYRNGCIRIGNIVILTLRTTQFLC